MEKMIENLMKVCTKCKIEKQLNCFSKHLKNIDFLQFQCKNCAKENQKLWYSNNIEKVKQTSKDWHKNNPEKAKARIINFKVKNPERRKQINLKCTRKRTKELSNTYIKIQLKDKGFPQELINNPEIIEIQRLIIQTKRLCKK